ncbi:MAG: hypothetical protein ACJA08_003507 [Cyclobacteriaceae bacterium]|jgi:hypothetical protein
MNAIPSKGNTFVIIFEDATKEKKTEEDLKTSEESYK